MRDRLVNAIVWALQPYDRAWERHVRRQYRKGKFKRPNDLLELPKDPRTIGRPCVVARQPGEHPWQDDLWEREHGHGVYDGSFR